MSDDDPKAQLVLLLERLKPIVRRFMDNFMEEQGFAQEEDLIYGLIVGFVLSQDNRQADEVWKRIGALWEPGDEFCRRLEKRMRAMRRLQWSKDAPVCTRADYSVFLDARGITDPEKREAATRAVAKGIFENAADKVRSLEEEKDRYSGRADPAFPRRYAEKNPWIRTDKETGENVDAIQKALAENELFFEHLSRVRQDLYRLITWPVHAHDEAERLLVGLPPAEDKSERESEHARILRLIEEREAVKADLIRRGFTPGSDDYELVINAIEARIRRLAENNE